VLGSTLLFLVLAFVFPLRFLGTWLITGPLFYGGIGRTMVDGQIVSMGGGVALRPFYAGTFTAVFVVFALLNWNAYRHRTSLELDDVEKLIVRREIGQHLTTVTIGLLSLVAAGFGQEFWAGAVFFLMGPVHGLWEYRSGALISAAVKRRDA